MGNSERLTMTIPEFAEATGCSRNLAYMLARANKLPVQVIYLGEKRMCVSRRAVGLLLQGEDTQERLKKLIQTLFLFKKLKQLRSRKKTLLSQY